MIGDSLIQDNADAPFDALLDKYYHNGTRVTVIPAVGSGTSLAAWDNPNNSNGLDLTDAVINQDPDLVILGGISNAGVGNATITNLIDTIRSQVQAAFNGHTPEFLLMSGPTYDPTEGTELGSSLGAINTNGLPNTTWQEFISATDTTSSVAGCRTSSPPRRTAITWTCVASGASTCRMRRPTAPTWPRSTAMAACTPALMAEVLGQGMAEYLEAPVVNNWTWSPAPRQLVIAGQLGQLRRAELQRHPGRVQRGDRRAGHGHAGLLAHRRHADLRQRRQFLHASGPGS